MAPGGPEQVSGWLMMTMGRAGQPTSDLDLRFPILWRMYIYLSLRFPMCLGPSYALAARLCCQIVQGQVRDQPPMVVF